MSDEKTSNIRQATPKQGLDTGSVEGAKGGLISGKERVAMEYSKDLSGEQGPVAMFDAVDEIAAKRVEQALNRITFAGRGGASIFGANGSFSVVSRQGAPESGVLIEDPKGESRLDLVSGENEEHTLRAPKIVSGVNDLTTDIVITNAPISLGAGKWVVFKIDDVGVRPYTVTVDVVDEGEPYYTFDDDDNLTEAVIPIYRLTDEAIDSMSVLVREGVYATRFLNGEVLVLSSRFVQVSSKPIGRFVPLLIPL